MERILIETNAVMNISSLKKGTYLGFRLVIDWIIFHHLFLNKLSLKRAKRLDLSPWKYETTKFLDELTAKTILAMVKKDSFLRMIQREITIVPHIDPVGC